MKKVLLLGSTGMLGSAVYNALKDKHKLILTTRSNEHTNKLVERYGESDNLGVWFDAASLAADYETKSHTYMSNFLKIVGDVDFVINAIGVTIPFSQKNPALTYFINAALPHILARHFGPRLIHITTDCVYSGKEGAYNELSPKSPVDIYGLSKSLGEPKTCFTLRTSIIGPELHDHTGLLAWALQQRGKVVKGFTNHYWNGITTHQFAQVCDKIMSGYYQPGLYHVFSDPISKYEMLEAFRAWFNIDCGITPVAAPVPINRTLRTVFAFNSSMNIPTFQEMLSQIK